jgi:hypothetical protein
MKSKSTIVLFLFSLVLFAACESSEDLSYGKDHEVPSYQVLTDSLIVNPGETVTVKVAVTDNAGLNKVVFSYGNWLLRESISLQELNYPTAYSFETTITIPEDAEKEWEEELIENTGVTTKIIQQYHQLSLEATDIHMNVRNIPIYIKVK